MIFARQGGGRSKADALQGRKHEVCALAPKGGKDAANKGQQATTQYCENQTAKIVYF